MRLLFLTMMAAATMMAADVTGTWKGTLFVTRDGGENEGPAHLVLKQEGGKVTGTAGPRAEQQYAISEGKEDGGAVTFTVETEGAVMRFALKLEGEELKGAVTRERDGEAEKARLAVKREK